MGIGGKIEIDCWVREEGYTPKGFRATGRERERCWSWCQSRCILIKGGCVLVEGNSELRGSLSSCSSRPVSFTLSFPDKGGERSRRGGGDQQHRGAPCLQTPAAGYWHRRHSVYVWACVCLCAWERSGRFDLLVWRITIFTRQVFASAIEEGATHRNRRTRDIPGLSHCPCEYGH